MTKFATIKLIVATRRTNINNPFLYRVGMSKIFYSFGLGFNSAFYGAFYFVKGPIKIELDTVGFD